MKNRGKDSVGFSHDNTCFWVFLQECDGNFTDTIIYTQYINSTRLSSNIYYQYI